MEHIRRAAILVFSFAGAWVIQSGQILFGLVLVIIGVILAIT